MWFSIWSTGTFCTNSSIFFSIYVFMPKGKRVLAVSIKASSSSLALSNQPQVQFICSSQIGEEEWSRRSENVSLTTGIIPPRLLLAWREVHKLFIAASFIWFLLGFMSLLHVELWERICVNCTTAELWRRCFHQGYFGELRYQMSSWPCVSSFYRVGRV